MQNIIFNEETKKDSLLVTPIGICLNYYETSNNFIFVSFNGNRIKMYDNNNLTVGDAAIQAQFPNDGLFPKRGDALEFTVNKKARMIRGLPGEPARIYINDEPATINSKIHANDIIRVVESTKGASAEAVLEDLDELGETITVNVNGKAVVFPKFAMVNNSLQSKFYSIQQNDDINILPYYTVRQIADFMDVILANSYNIYVNNNLADENTFVYDNFTVNWTEEVLKFDKDIMEEEALAESYEDLEEDPEYEEDKKEETEKDNKKEEKTDQPKISLTVIVNDKPVTLQGKSSYVFVDVFDAIKFDLNDPKGRSIVTNLNGRQAQYMENLKNNDVIEIYWKEL